MDVLESDPRGRQVADRVGRHVDRVGMLALLAALVRAESFKRHGLPPQEQVHPLPEAPVVENLPDLRYGEVRVERPAGRTSPGAGVSG